MVLRKLTAFDYLSAFEREHGSITDFDDHDPVLVEFQKMVQQAFTNKSKQPRHVSKDVICLPDPSVEPLRTHNKMLADIGDLLKNRYILIDIAKQLHQSERRISYYCRQYQLTRTTLLMTNMRNELVAKGETVHDIYKVMVAKGLYDHSEASFTNCFYRNAGYIETKGEFIGQLKKYRYFRRIVSL